MVMPEVTKSATAMAMKRNMPITPRASMNVSLSVSSPMLLITIVETGLRMHKSTPSAIRKAWREDAFRYSFTSVRDTMRPASKVWLWCNTLSMPRSSASSSRLPNSAITVPMASFSVLPSAMSSRYLSSIICPSSYLAFCTSGVFGRFKNIVSK